MYMEKVREEITKYGKLMIEEGLTESTGGYIAYCNREDGVIATTPSATPYLDITPGDIVIVDMEGNQLEDCNGKVATTELPAVEIVFKKRDDFNAIVHCHSKYASVFSMLRETVPVSYFMMTKVGGDLRCTDYYIYTAAELGDDILDKMRDRKAVLMGNHGLLAVGDTVKEAYELAKTIEFGLEVYWRARCIGKPVDLTQEEINVMLEANAAYKKRGGSKDETNKG